MSESYVHKNGLIYTEDMSILVAVDTSSDEFTGKVPFGPVAISEEAFSESSATEISLPDSVKEMPAALFENASQLQSVKLPAEMSELPPYLFSGCSSLTKVYMPDTLVGFPEGLFNGCSSLKEIPFRENIQELPENVFAGCTSLKSIVIPNTVSKISSGAFKDCSNLEAVVISAKLFDLAEDAFEGCNSIRTIRVDPDNHLFYVGDDGNLYEKNISLDGDDILRLAIVQRSESENSFVEEVGDSEENSDDLTFVSTDDLEDDDTFSSEIDASEEEKEAIDIKNDMGEENMSDENTSDIDSIFADIMNDEKERTAAGSEAAVSEQETAVLTQTMEVMADQAPSSNVAVSTEELENLFASHEAEESKSNDDTDESGIDGKTQILINSVEYSRILENPEAESSAREDSDLFVIAENLSEEGDFSSKLITCVNKVARIQDFKRIIMLKGLPLDNEEFMQFYFHFINKRNVIIACAAENAATLSDYCKKICEESRISITKDDLAEQRKTISVKNDSLIKLVIQDLFN